MKGSGLLSASARAVAVLAVLAVLAPRTARACVGTECFVIWSTDDGGGALTAYWDFENRKIQTFKSFCSGGQCFYNTIEDGFITTPDAPPSGYFPLADGTSVRFEVVDIDPAASVHINGEALDAPGASALLGTAPTLHNHPSWQLTVPDGDPPMEFALSFKLTTDSAQYAESQTFSVVLTDAPPPTPEATPTATASPVPSISCPGDCDGSGDVTVRELVLGIDAALHDEQGCSAMDGDGDGAVAVDELVNAVDAALNGCPNGPTPTPTIGATFADIQSAIFSPRCAIPYCHDNGVKSGNLVLDADHSYEQLVDVPPDVESARDAGLLRVDPGHPENSFLIVKLEGPPLGQGSRMPASGRALTESEIQVIRDWIAAGAQP